MVRRKKKFPLTTNHRVYATSLAQGQRKNSQFPLSTKAGFSKLRDPWFTLNQ